MWQELVQHSTVPRVTPMKECASPVINISSDSCTESINSSKIQRQAHAASRQPRLIRRRSSVTLDAARFRRNSQSSISTNPSRQVSHPHSASYAPYTHTREYYPYRLRTHGVRHATGASKPPTPDPHGDASTLTSKRYMRLQV